jgi:hypothetical protein
VRKTSESGNVSIYDLTVDTAGLMQLMHAGRQTVTEVGIAAKAKIRIGNRVLWNVSKIKKYLDDISEGEDNDE